MAPIYDVNRKGYGTGFNLTHGAAIKDQARYGGTVMVSVDGGRTWKTA